MQSGAPGGGCEPGGRGCFCRGAVRRPGAEAETRKYFGSKDKLIKVFSSEPVTVDRLFLSKIAGLFRMPTVILPISGEYTSLLRGHFVEKHD